MDSIRARSIDQCTKSNHALFMRIMFLKKSEESLLPWDFLIKTNTIFDNTKMKYRANAMNHKRESAVSAKQEMLRYSYAYHSISSLHYKLVTILKSDTFVLFLSGYLSHVLHSQAPYMDEHMYRQTTVVRIYSTYSRS